MGRVVPRCVTMGASAVPPTVPIAIACGQSGCALGQSETERSGSELVTSRSGSGRRYGPRLLDCCAAPFLRRKGLRIQRNQIARGDPPGANDD